jgi:hypothetical protein
MPINGLVKYKFFDFNVNEIYKTEPVDLTTPPIHFDEFTETLKFFTAGNVYEPNLDLDELDKLVTLPA